MASRVDERGYEQNGNMRQREPYAGQDNGEDPRLNARNRQRDDRGTDRPREDMASGRSWNERQAGRMGDEPAPVRMTSAFGEAFVSAFERSTAAFGENLRMYQDETARFMTERLEQDTALFEQLGKSRSIFDLVALQQQWFASATRAYSDEWMRLSKLTKDVTNRNVNEARSAADDTRRAVRDAE